MCLSDAIDTSKKSIRISKSSCSILEFNVEDLLALPRLKQGILTKNIEKIDVAEVVSEVIEILSYKSEKRGIQVDFEMIGPHSAQLGSAGTNSKLYIMTDQRRL
mgnify:CR=1 FL=1